MGFGWLFIAVGIFPFIVPVGAFLIGLPLIVAGIVMVQLSGRRVKRLKKEEGYNI
jgi:hypothetical protein